MSDFLAETGRPGIKALSIIRISLPAWLVFCAILAGLMLLTDMMGGFDRLPSIVALVVLAYTVMGMAAMVTHLAYYPCARKFYRRYYPCTGPIEGIAEEMSYFYDVRLILRFLMIVFLRWPRELRRWIVCPYAHHSHSTRPVWHGIIKGKATTGHGNIVYLYSARAVFPLQLMIGAALRAATVLLLVR